MTRRVVVTGMGIVSPLGVGTEATWNRLVSGHSGIGPISHFDASAYDCRIAGEVRGFDPLDFVSRKDVKKMDLFIQYAVAAAQFAMEGSGLEVGPANAARVGVATGGKRLVFGRAAREKALIAAHAPAAAALRCASRRTRCSW